MGGNMSKIMSSVLLHFRHLKSWFRGCSVLLIINKKVSIKLLRLKTSYIQTNR